MLYFINDLFRWFLDHRVFSLFRITKAFGLQFNSNIMFILYISGTREQAFVYALASASAAHTIARACADGSLDSCTCGSTPHEPPHGDFKWGGCGHNVRHGLKFARNFADAPWRQKSVRKKVEAAVNRHNNQAGRRVSPFNALYIN